eukprot:604099-Pyramimonas_sp.AAC.1
MAQVGGWICITKKGRKIGDEEMEVDRYNEHLVGKKAAPDLALCHGEIHKINCICTCVCTHP